MRILFLSVMYFMLTEGVWANTSTTVNREHELDQQIQARIEYFRIRPLKARLAEPNRSLIQLGRRLFVDQNLSGNKNISCLTCHDPARGTSDGRMLSQTHDGLSVLKRNSPSLFNLEYNNFMFWDGSVFYNPSENSFTTPLSDLNGINPKAFMITSVLKSALAAQVIFPMMSHEEMRGARGDNEIANAKNHLEGWSLLVKRLLAFPIYQKLFQEAYGIKNLNEVNIGHVGNAIAEYIFEDFSATETPYNRYLNGEVSALTTHQKTGFLVFMEKGCIACHQGATLSLNNFFASVGVPQISKEPFENDVGRGAMPNEGFRKYFFKTPSLINVALTAPYMHNGAFATLEEVLDHYENFSRSIDQYVVKNQTDFSLPVNVVAQRNQEKNRELKNSVKAQVVSLGISMSREERMALLDFLRGGLTDPKSLKSEY